jgi:hypothetical protein
VLQEVGIDYVLSAVGLRRRVRVQGPFSAQFRTCFIPRKPSDNSSLDALGHQGIQYLLSFVLRTFRQSRDPDIEYLGT